MKKITVTVFILIIFFFIACNNETNRGANGVDKDTAAYLQKGNQIAKNTFDTLRTVLLKTIASRPASAARRCS